MLLSVMFLVLTGFSLYHTFLALSNSTTNERSKRGWLSAGVNVHSHHELLILNPYYTKIQNELKDLNARIVAKAYSDVGRVPPPPTGGDPDDFKRHMANTKAATQAAARLVEEEIRAKMKGQGNETNKGKLGDTSAIAEAGFPAGPYSPELTVMMRDYTRLKIEVVDTYHKLQRLQSQGYADGDATVDSASESKSYTDQGLRYAPVEATEGCVPTMSTPPSIQLSVPPKKTNQINPYSLGIINNLKQLLFPPKMGQKVPMAKGFRVVNPSNSSSASSSSSSSTPAPSRSSKSSNKKKQ